MAKTVTRPLVDPVMVTEHVPSEMVQVFELKETEPTPTCSQLTVPLGE